MAAVQQCLQHVWLQSACDVMIIALTGLMKTLLTSSLSECIVIFLGFQFFCSSNFQEFLNRAKIKLQLQYLCDSLILHVMRNKSVLVGIAISVDFKLYCILCTCICKEVKCDLNSC